MKIGRFLPFLGLLFAATINAEGEVKTFDQGMIVDDTQLSKGYAAPARIAVQGSWDVFLQGEFLYWQVNSDSLTYALNTLYDDAGDVIDAELLSPSAKWRPGVRVSLGFTLGHDNWMLIADWYHIIGLTSGEIINATEGDTQEVLIPFLIPLDIFTTCYSASQFGKANINVVDLVFSRPFYLGSALTINPTFGIKGYWNKMSSYNYYEDVVGAFFIIPFTADYIDVDFTYKTWGLGPVLGVNGNWLLGCGFKVLGGADFSILYERANAKVSILIPEDIYYIQPLADLNVKNQNLIRPYVKGEIGLGWGSYFDNNNWYVDLAAVYEMHYWSNYYTASVPFGNLWMHGASFRLRFDF